MEETNGDRMDNCDAQDQMIMAMDVKENSSVYHTHMDVPVHQGSKE